MLWRRRSLFIASNLGGLASKAALADIPTGTPISSVIVGNVMQTDNSGAYLARHVGHYAGVPIDVPALTVNRLCGSGFQSAINGMQEIQLGQSEVVLTGGAENMSMAPYSLHNVRWGTRYGVNLQMEDSLAAALTDRYPTPTPMGITAENLGEKYNLTREDCDKWALVSQQRWAKANEAGIFRNEIVPVEVKVKKEMKTMDTDEHPRPQATIESLAKLPSVFKKGGLVTAANASGINDGASAVVIASEDALKKHNLKPLARIIDYHIVAVEPSIMGIGAADALTGLMKKTGLTVDKVDLFEINEAFAAQFLACQKEVGLPDEKTNVNGGAIAIGHPLGSSGSRILAHLTHELQRTGKNIAMGSACIGGGQGIAMAIERC